MRTGLLPHTSGSSAIKVSSTRDIPSVTLSNIPHVDANAFRPYLTQAGSLYEVFRRAKDDRNEKIIQSVKRSSRDDSSPVESVLHGLQRRQSSIQTVQRTDSSSSSRVPVEPLHNNRRTSGGGFRRAGLAVAPLSTIPNVYSDEDFRLENPRTFDIVSERSEIAQPLSGSNGSAIPPGSSGKKALATNAILQEKLSWYMDIVEIHLISSISAASTSFFTALGSLQTLHSEAAQSVVKTKELRGELTKLDQDMAAGGLKILALRKRRENIRKLGDAVQQLHQVVEAVTQCEAQVNSGDLEEALSGLARVENLMAGEDGTSSERHRSPLTSQVDLIDLREIKALEGASSDIAVLQRRIGKGFEIKFIETLLGDLRNHIRNVPLSATLQRWDTASNRSRKNHSRAPSHHPAYLQSNGDFRRELLTHLKGLARSDAVIPATVAYREAILREFKTIIRRHLPSSSDDDTESSMSTSTQSMRHVTQQEKSSILTRNLRALEAEEAEDMLKRIYSNTSEALRRLGTQVKVLLDITSSLSNPLRHDVLRSPLKSPHIQNTDSYFRGMSSPGLPPSVIKHEEIQQALDLSSLSGQAVDIAQAQIIKILKVRSDQSTRLALTRFLRYFTLNRLFADECEAVSGQSGIALKTVVNTHIKDFMTNFGDLERQRLVQTMDADLWDARDFTDIDSRRLSRIVEASTREVQVWSNDAVIWEGVNQATDQSQPNGSTHDETPNAKDKVRSAIIDEQNYILPESAIAVIIGIENFEHLLAGIPSMTSEISNLLSDYLKLFNSRSSQLILGAGATRSAGLKNITTKHLALSSQALSFVIALIPYIREFIRKYFSSSNLMTEFDKLKRLYQDHQSGIHDKLVDIMSSRAASHVNSMKKIEWERVSDNATANDYMLTLVKETTTLHKVLSKHLPESTVRMIMVPVMQSYREQWGKAFGELEVKNQAGKDRYSSHRNS